MQKAINGIIILPPFAMQIIDKSKHYEFRSRELPRKYLNTPIFLLSKGKIYGIIKFIESERFGSGYSWKIKVLEKWFPQLNYDHPQGAQCWVTNVEYEKSKQTSLNL